MPIRKIDLLDNTLYHIYNRGLNEQIIFHDTQDYQRFLGKIRFYLKKIPSIEILAFSLLPNHFHLLLQSSESGLEISKFMRKLQQSHALYFNSKYKSGLKSPVFEGRFKAKIISHEDYLHSVFTYVELNPVKHEFVEDIKDWPYSSFNRTL